ncbi:MAG: tryptophan synthase subunit beta [Endomicrobiia bacterium]|nr:tryptophan synthase subunit beta [Endomicrobiia bacterium]
MSSKFPYSDGYKSFPPDGFWGDFGGRFAPETLVPPLEAITRGFKAAMRDGEFRARLAFLLKNYVGRPTPLYYASNLTRRWNRARVYLKREDLAHTGSHKINNTVAQCLLAINLGKKRVIAETGAGQHGVATATAAALLNLECDVYMGSKDVERQSANVERMKLLGARVIAVNAGSMTLKDAINEAMRDWTARPHDTFYVIGSVVGPHPYPSMVAHFQSVIGAEARRQILSAEGRLPSRLIACVGGGSNAMGLFRPFYRDRGVAFIGVEAAGRGLDTLKHSATLSKGSPGVLHGARSYVLQDKNGQILETHSISAGLDYPGVGPEHSFYKETRRAIYAAADDDTALAGFDMLSRAEGILPALETAHALGYLDKTMPSTRKGESVIVCLSGRGDKDLGIVAASSKKKSGRTSRPRNI